MHDKRLPLALRLDRNPPSLQAMEVSTTQGQALRYTRVNLPHYLCPFLGGKHEEAPGRLQVRGPRN